MLQKPGKNLTIYNMASLMNEAWLKASTPQNIKAGFQVSGIWSLNPIIVTDVDYLPSAVTDQPIAPQDHPNAKAGPLAASNYGIGKECLPSTSTEKVSSPTKTNFTISPAEFRGYPKAEPKKVGRRKRPAGRAMIATSTPEMKQLKQNLFTPSTTMALKTQDVTTAF